MKQISLLVFALLFTLAVQGQGQVSFSHSGGLSIYSSTELVTGIAGVYSPRLNLVELGDEMTVSLGTHLGLGASLSANSRTGGSTALVFDLPVVAELNFGCGSHPDARSIFGGFVGAGYGYSHIGSSGGFIDELNLASGVLVNGGLRVYVLERMIGLRASYLLNSQSRKDEGYSNVVSLGLIYLFN